MAFKKEGNTWVLEDGKCVQQHMIYILLETFKYVSVKSPVPEAAVSNINEQILKRHKKIEIFQNGELSKTWYVGNPTQDHLGTYMLLKDPKKGKSPEPFIMFLPNMNGTLQARFSTNPLDYVCSEIFTYDPLDIKSINVEVPDSANLNFKIIAIDDNTFELYNNEHKVESFDTARVRSYLVGYRKIHFEHHNRTANENHIDSLRNSTPYYKIAVTNDLGETNNIVAYLKSPGFNRYDLVGNIIEHDRDRLWVFTKYDELTVCQYHVFDKLLRDINYFKIK
jgi:hypothetical protein